METMKALSVSYIGEMDAFDGVECGEIVITLKDSDN